LGNQVCFQTINTLHEHVPGIVDMNNTSAGLHSMRHRCKCI
jgi:hypothetical protein